MTRTDNRPHRELADSYSDSNAGSASETESAMATASGSAPVGRGRRRGRRVDRFAIGLLAILAAVALWRVAGPEPGESSLESDGAAGTLSARIAELEQRSGDGDQTVLTELGLAYIARAAEVEDPTFYAKARSVLNRAEEQDSNSFETLHAFAALELAAHQFPPSLEYARSAHGARPDSPDGYAVLVDAEIESGNYEQARVYLDEWSALKPSLASLSRVSYFRELTGDWDGAIAAMRQAVSAGFPGTDELATVEAYLGDVYYGAGDLERAEQAYRDSLQTSPQNLLGEVGLARTMAAGGQRDAAVARLARLAETVPAPNVTGLLGELHLSSDRTSEAADAFVLMVERYALFEASGANSSLEMAVFEAQYGDPERGLELARLAHRDRSTVLSADAMVLALTRLGRPSEALPFVEQALALGTEYGSIHRHAAIAYGALGQDELAEQHLRHALELQPWLEPASEAQIRALAGRLGVVLP